eukprot:85561_1
MIILSFFLISVLTRITSTTNQPNILFLIPDQWRFDWADTYWISNLSINTPNFRDIVANGTRFVNTIVGSPLCAPSRSCIASGREYDYIGISKNKDLPEDVPTFYKLIQDTGYWVMVSGKDDLTKTTGCGVNGTYRLTELGFNDQERCQGKDDHIDNYPNVSDPYGVWLSQKNTQKLKKTWWEIDYNCIGGDSCCPGGQRDCPYAEVFDPNNITRNNMGYEDNYIDSKTIELLERKPKNKPWFIQVNYVGPHPPFAILQTMNDSVQNRSYPPPVEWTDNHPQKYVLARKDYAAEIMNIDISFGHIIDWLRNNNEYENTVICISSDHGELLGDFNNWGKKMPWIGSTNVPLVCSGPNILKNKIINTYVTNMDLAATFLDITGSKIPPKSNNFSSISLNRFLNGTWSDNNNGYRKYVYSGLTNWRTVIQKINDTITWKYICCQDVCPGNRNSTTTKYKNVYQALYNLQNDLYEENNLAKMYPDVMDYMNKTYLPSGFCNENGNYNVNEYNKWYAEED